MALHVYLYIGIAFHKNNGYRVVIYVPVLTVEAQCAMVSSFTVSLVHKRLGRHGGCNSTTKF